MRKETEVIETTDALIAARRRAKQEIKRLEKRNVYLTEAEKEELREWRKIARKLDHEVGKRIVQLPLL